MSALGSLVVKLALEYAEYTKGLDKSSQDALKFAQDTQKHFDKANAVTHEFFTGVVKGAASAAVAYLGVSSAVAAFNDSIDNLASLDDMSQKTGATVENLSRLQKVATMTGTEFGNVDNSLEKLAKNMAGIDDESNKTFKALALLGVSSVDTAGKMRDPAEVLIDIAKGLQNYEDGAGKVAIANDLFGKSGAELLPYLNDVNENVDRFVGVSAEAARNASEMQDRFGALKVQADELKTEFSMALLPVLNDVSKAIIDTYKESGKLESAWVALGGLGAFLFTDEFDTDKQKLAALNEQLNDLVLDQKLREESFGLDGSLKRLLFGGYSFDELPKAIAYTRYEIEQLQAKIKNDAAPKSGTKPAVNLGATREEGEVEREATARAARLQREQESQMKQRAKLLEGLEKEKVMLSMTAAEAKVYEAVQLGITGKQLEKVKALTKSIEAHKANEKAMADDFKVSQEHAAQNLEFTNSLERGVDAIKSQVEVQREYNDRIGLTSKQIAELDAAELERQATSKDSLAVTMDLVDWSGKLGDAYRDQANSLRTLAGLKRIGAEKSSDTDVTKAKELLDIMTELDNITQKAAQGMAASFGSVGSAIGGLTTALSGYSRAQAAISAKLADDNKKAGGDSQKLAAAQLSASEQTARAQISSYANMASAAKGFFKENSTGYKVMETAEKGFRAVEMAMAIETMLEKSGLVTAFTGLFVTSKATETGVILATESTMTAATVTGEAARNAAKVPGVFMSFMSMLGPWGAAAAGVAIAAVLGGAFSGGGGASVDMSAAAVQKKQGTGTVFGDSDAKSDSIAKSLELLESNSDLMLPATMQMAASLRNIESSMGGLTNIIVRTPGVTNASNMNIVTGTKTNGLTWGSDSFMVKLNSAISGFLFGSTKSAITDGGLQIGGSVDSLQRGQGINQYANINTVKKGALGGLFGGNSNTNTTQTQAASSEISQQFGLIFTSLQSTLSAAATALGGNGKEVGEAVKSFVIDTTKISLQGLKGAELQSAINAVISGAMDNVSQSVFPELEKFRQVGEGYTQTVTRIAVNYSSVDSILQSIGTSFGAVGISSVAARERLIELAGGVDKLAQQTAAFGQTYLSEAEQMAPVTKLVTEAMSALGLSSITTREQFKEAVLSLTNSGALATEAGAATYAGLMNVAEAFAKVHPEIAKTTNAAKSAADALSERNELQNQFDQLTMTSAQLLQKQRDALDASNQALFDQVQAAKAANAAQEEQAATAKAAQDAQVAATKTAQDAQAAAAKAAADALASTNAGYQQQIDALVKASLPLAEQRAIETRGMADSTLALYNRLELLKAEAKATADAAAAHQTMLATLKTNANSSLTVLGKSVATEKMGAKTALDAQIAIINAQKSAAAASFQWSKMAGEASLETATKANQKIAALAGSLNSTLESMRLSATQESDRMSAQAQISQALLRAKTTGMLPDVDVLSDALKTVSQPNQNLFSSYTDFARDFYVTAGQIADLSAITGDALSKSDAMVEMAKAQLASTEQAAAASAASFDEQIKKAQEEYELQISQFEQVMTNAQAQLEAALGTNVAILSMAEALRGFQSSLGAMVAGGVTHPATGTVAGSALGAVGKSNAVMSAESAASLSGFKAQLKANSNYSAAIDAAGGYQFAYDAWINGSHAKGLDSVPFDGYVAELHQGEMVLPAHVAQSVRGAPAGGSNSDLTRELLEEMRQMKNEIILLKHAAIKTSDNTKQAADILDSVTEGGSVMRTEEV